ncbi:GNAT family N-acetyltransferase, partial [Kineococcus sp. G2]|uniref:GNAT family N-acetyltransferase n=1 Tax=Kineococcus sp. G2 TaxID=3127484 RepID=UPI00301B7CB0
PPPPPPPPPRSPHHPPPRPWSVQLLTPAAVAGAQEVVRACVAQDFGDVHDPVVHADVDDPLGRYPGTAEAFLLVAVDDATGGVLGTAGLRDGRLRPGAGPQHLVDRYADGRTGQLVRVCVRRGERRRGIARGLVAAVLARAAADDRCERLALHTYRHSPGSVAFWEALGARVVADDTAGASRSVFYEFEGFPPS